MLKLKLLLKLMLILMLTLLLMMTIFGSGLQPCEDAQPAYFMLRDNDRKPAAILFDFDKSSVSREDGPTTDQRDSKVGRRDSVRGSEVFF